MLDFLVYMNSLTTRPNFNYGHVIYVCTSIILTFWRWFLEEQVEEKLKLVGKVGNSLLGCLVI